MKKQLLFTILLLLPLVASAYDVKIDGIYYDLKGGIAMVTYGDWNNDPYSASPKKGDGRYKGKVVIPESITYNGNSYKVTIIGDAFKMCPDLTSITIPPTVTKIGDFFCTGGVSNLKEVHISDLAAWCSVSMTGSISLLYYAHHLYLNNKEVKELVIPNSVTSIGDRAFSGYSGLTSVTIPNSVTSIGEGAFSNCTNLTSVTIGNSVTSIGKEAFYSCSGLTSVTIGNSVTSIGESAFFGCTGLTTIDIPENVTSIGERAFDNCTTLTSIVLSNNLQYLSYNFNNCGITSIEFPSSMSFIWQMCYGCVNLTTIVIPSSVTSIENSFENCPKIEDVYCYAEIPHLDNNGGYTFCYSIIVYAILYVHASFFEESKCT